MTWTDWKIFQILLLRLNSISYFTWFILVLLISRLSLLLQFSLFSLLRLFLLLLLLFLQFFLLLLQFILIFRLKWRMLAIFYPNGFFNSSIMCNLFSIKAFDSMISHWISILIGCLQKSTVVILILLIPWFSIITWGKLLHKSYHCFITFRWELFIKCFFIVRGNRFASRKKRGAFRRRGYFRLDIILEISDKANASL